MRVVVADATPLHYLILIGAIEILLRLFEKIHVPIEIREELSRNASPPAVRTWMQQPPDSDEFRGGLAMAAGSCSQLETALGLTFGWVAAALANKKPMQGTACAGVGTLKAC